MVIQRSRAKQHLQVTILVILYSEMASQIRRQESQARKDMRLRTGEIAQQLPGILQRSRIPGG